MPEQLLRKQVAVVADATLLVLCSQSLFRFADLGDDGLCRGGSRQRVWGYRFCDRCSG